MRRPPLPATVAVSVLLVGVAAVAGVSRSAPVAQDQQHDPQIREELLLGARPSPDCPDAGEAPTPGPGEVLVSVVRVVDGCLAYGSEVVDDEEVAERLGARRAEPDVVAADAVVERRPGAGALRLGEGDQADQWALAPEHLDGDQVRSLWPDDAPEVRVAIIDTGIDHEHADLAGQVAERAPWVHLYDGEHDDHGTHVAGTVAAADDGAGVVGLTPAAQLMDVQYYDPHRENGYAGPSRDMGEYVRWAVDHGADVINMSIQGPDPSDTELTAILYAELQGVVVVGITGNCGGEHAGHDEWWRPPFIRDPNPCDGRHETKWPAGYAPVLSVANHTAAGERYDTSSANATVDIAAPGTGIVSTCLTGGSEPRAACTHTGTSQAAPFVSATAALLRARHPEATPAAIREAITRSARTGNGQPAGTRTDELGWGLLDPAAAAEYLDEHPGGTQVPEAPATDRTQVAFKNLDDGWLYAFDDGIVHPVDQIDDDTWVSSVDWSADRHQLVATAGDTMLLWNGPGSQLEPDDELHRASCGNCRAAYIATESGPELVAAIGNGDEILHFDTEALGEDGTVPLQLPAPEEPAVLHGEAGGRLVVAHSTTAGADSPDALWLVDPLTGEEVARHAPDGNTDVSAVAVDADGGQIAYAGVQPGGPCGTTDQVYVVDGDDLSEISVPQPPDHDWAELEVQDLFFNGDTLYATMGLASDELDAGYCTYPGSAGLWRLNEGGEGWELVDDQRPVVSVRPVEGMTEEPHTGKVMYTEDNRVTFEPTGATGADIVNLGTSVSERLWATPTTTEINLASTATPPVSTTSPPPEGEGTEPTPDTTDAAIARFEEFLHALGEGDIDTLCEIAGPAAQEAEDQGFGPCEETYGIVVGTMISPEQAAALRSATVDPGLVEATTPGEVYIPVDAVVSPDPSVTFSESDLGSYTLSYRDGNWFVVD